MRSPSRLTDSSRSAEKMLSRSWIGYSYRVSYPSASRNCWRVHCTLGWAVTLQWIKRRLRCSITTNKYSRRKCRGHGDEEITGNDSLGMAAQESRPAQITSRPTSRMPGQILVHRPGRHPDPDLQEQLIGDTFLAPRGILIPDPANQRLELRGNRRSAGAGLQPPEQFPSRSVPANQSLGAHYYQSRVRSPWMQHHLLDASPRTRARWPSRRAGSYVALKHAACHRCLLGRRLLTYGIRRS